MGAKLHFLELGISGLEPEGGEVGNQIDVQFVGSAALSHGFLPGGLHLQLAEHSLHIIKLVLIAGPATLYPQ